MSQFANTPESLLPRSDSRNPASTCRGINVNGKPCRRTLAATTRSTASSARDATVFKGQMIDTAAFYCWQHKNQVSDFIGESPKRRQAEAIISSNRNSIDSLVERLGILEVSDDPKRSRRHTQSSVRSHRGHHGGPNRTLEKQSHVKKTSFCCFNLVNDSESFPKAPQRVAVSGQEISYEKRSAVPRPSSAFQRPVFIRDPRSGESSIIQQRSAPVTPERWPHASSPILSRQSAVSADILARQQYLETPTQPPPASAPTSHSSKTSPLLSLIPQHLSPQTTALLLTELVKPISDADEDGYIYIFWITPQESKTAKAPTEHIASNLLPPPGRPNTSRRTSDALRAAQSIDPRPKGCAGHPGTIRLKIGRTSNVHRRLNEWSKQCSHDLTLIRYYPYVPSSPLPSPSPSPTRRDGSGMSSGQGRRVPHVHRVERLIHIELADQRVKGEGPCSQCGKEHREWFELNATKEALRLVDECVRRWVSWGEQRE